jgi:murein L,D-transpeptidase YafK
VHPFRSSRLTVILFGLAVAAGGLLIRHGRTDVSDHRALRDACIQAGVRYPPPSPRVEVRKAERVLTLFSGQTRLKRYRVGLGFRPIGDKRRQGDGRTPEGDFYVCTRLKQSKFHRFLGLSYPAPDDAAQAQKDGAITAAERAQITHAHRKRRKPTWDTALGGAVGIHGSGGGMDWTAGCVAVENAEIVELFAVLPLGAPVRVLP